MVKACDAIGDRFPPPSSPTEVILQKVCVPSIASFSSHPFHPFHPSFFLSLSRIIASIMPNLPQSAATAKFRLAALSEQLVAPIPDQGNFEDIPKLKKIAGDSDGKRLKNKVCIITGILLSLLSYPPQLMHPRHQLAHGHWQSYCPSVCTEWS